MPTTSGACCARRRLLQAAHRTRRGGIPDDAPARGRGRRRSARPSPCRSGGPAVGHRRRVPPHARGTWTSSTSSAAIDPKDRRIAGARSTTTTATSSSTPAALAVDQPDRGSTTTIFADDFAFLRDDGDHGRAEADDPVAEHGPLPRRARRRSTRPSTPTSTSSGPTSPPPTRDEVARARRRSGCRYLQLDDTTLAYLNDPAQRDAMAARGEDADHHAPAVHRARSTRRCADRPADMRVTTHMCRGNFRSSWAAEGGYDYVAEALLRRAGRRRLLPASTTTSAPATSRRCASCRRGKQVVLGPRHHQDGRARGRRTRSSAASTRRRSTCRSSSSASRRSAASPPRSRATTSTVEAAAGEAAARRRGRRGGLGLSRRRRSWCAANTLSACSL